MLGPVLDGYGLQMINEKHVFLLLSLLPVIAAWQYFKYVSE